jgi:hypothetical protein
VGTPSASPIRPKDITMMLVPCPPNVALTVREQALRAARQAISQSRPGVRCLVSETFRGPGRGILGLVDFRLVPAPVVAAFAQAVRPLADVVALYVGGSLASGDYCPGVSDLDLVAAVAAPLGPQQRQELRRFHETFEQEHPSAAKLHCLYVPRDGLADVEARHWMWAHGRFGQRHLSGVARAELLHNGITVYGPPPCELLPPMDDGALRVAVRAELTGYWKRALRWPQVWLTDWCVDLGLLTLARAEAALTESRLITKREALDRLDRFGVPADLVQQISRRRRGEGTPLRVAQRVRRAYTARHLVARGLRALVSIGDREIPPSAGQT